MKVDKITNKIIHLVFETQKSICDALVRFQEHYESPEWHGRVFTLGQYREWYSLKYGANTFSRDWNGFNFPDYILNPFIKGLFDPLSANEQEIVDLFRYRTDKFYIIGTHTEHEDNTVLNHEICHGLYYTCESYREGVDHILSQYDVSDLYFLLSELGYGKEVWLDEAHAYCSADHEYLLEKGYEVDKDLHVRLHSLREIYLEKEKFDE